MNSPLLYVNQDEDDEIAIPVDNISHILKCEGRAEILLHSGASIKTREQYDYVVWAYSKLFKDRR